MACAPCVGRRTGIGWNNDYRKRRETARDRYWSAQRGTREVSGGGLIDLDKWPRRDHFEFFRVYESPFFNVTIQADVTELVSSCKTEGHSYFLSSLYLATSAANEVEAFRLRLRGDGVWRHERIGAGSTVLRDDETFAFGYFDFGSTYAGFERAGLRTLQELKHAPGPLEDHSRDDVIYFSVLPWIAFTSFQHAHRGEGDDSNPRIVFGKRHAVGGRQLMPVSVEVHHALADGLHVGQFVELLQQHFENPGEFLGS
jgi:chloramphenicol O-acetyltransferase type A